MSCDLIIPARAGSKGIPGKNIKPLNEKPLIAHLIDAAKEAACISNIYVSTDGDEIASIAKEYGAQVIMRPDDISGDKASSESAILHALECIERDGAVPDYTVFAQCTAPFTQGGDFDRAYKAAQDGDYDCVFAAKPFHGFIWEEQRSGSDAQAVAVNHDTSKPRAMRQDLKPQYQETGAFYMMKTSAFREVKSRFCGRTQICEIPEIRSLDIDTLEDWALAEALMSRR